MMEVKQNTSVDLNDLMTSTKSNGADEVDDAIMTDLSDRAPDCLLNCDLIKKNDQTTNIIELENGEATIISIIKDVDNVGDDLDTTVNSELEDALLAEDDVLPEVTNSKKIERPLSATEDILADKAETSNSTTSSNNIRDPGDDLDTLLSKINDIVEDCIENEIKNTDSKTVKLEKEINKTVENQDDIILKESQLEVDQKNVIDDKNLEDGQFEHHIEDISKELVLIEKTEVLINKENLPTSSDMPITTQTLSLNSVDEEVEENKNKSHSEEQVTPILETKYNSDTITPQTNRIDNVTENNLNIEKTEESKAEIVQDNKITSNSKDTFEDVQSSHLITAGNGKNPIVVESVEKNKETLNIENEVFVDKLPTIPDEIPLTEQTIAPGNAPNDESDDEIVFYVDQPPEVKIPKEMDVKSLGTVVEKEEPVMQDEETPSLEKTPHGDDDIVLLLDDDDEEVIQDKKENTNNKEIATNDINELNESANISVDSHTETKEKNIVIDNSDNARDDFSTENSIEKEKLANKTEVSQTAEETNSNCSSSSNLLQESKPIKSVADGVAPEEAENEEDEDDGDVELIIGEVKDTESSEKVEDTEIAPPAKRIRLSEDRELPLEKHESCDGSDELKMINADEKKQESHENFENRNNSLETHITLKRSHDVIEVEVNEKSNDLDEGINKKLKTDSLKNDAIVSDKLDEMKDDKDSEDVKVLDGDKNNIKAVPSYEPIRLYPAPEFGALKSQLPMSLDFLKKFRKSFDNMTKQDLEELVLQKVVEAIIHRSEFSEMRELIEKQEKLISAHRTKISELSKQFRDLEMVHNRVVKDIEQRNSQFIMPVKITRAVGLQVYIPNKKSLAEPSSSPPGLNISSSPQRPIAPQSSSTSNSSLTTVQRQYLSSQTDTQQQRAPATISSGTGTTNPNIRRGCVQKITPIRPVPGATLTASAGSTSVASTAYRNTSNHSAASQPRILNKNAAITGNSTAIQRPRYLSSNQESQRMSTQQQTSRTTNIPSNSQRVVANTATQSKPTSNVVTTVPRRSDPLPPSTSNSSTSSIVDNYINTLTHLTGGNTAVSITPAKPKEKAVIDLTDEDETPVQSSGAQTTSPMPVSQVSRRILPAQNSSSSQLQYGRVAPPLARVPPANQMVNNKNRQMSSLQAQKSNSFTSISTPPGTSITRINVAANPSNVQRVKYSHPAPLPATPAQAFNPSWKLPPPRPTIRISNLDNGIVISWTMEESMDRHAECVSYQIYAYQETSGPPMVDSWRHVGDVKAMLLPMAVTLTQFQEGQRYYFAVRAVDCHQRYGPFSLPKTWS